MWIDIVKQASYRRKYLKLLKSIKFYRLRRQITFFIFSSPFKLAKYVFYIWLCNNKFFIWSESQLATTFI